MPDIAQPVRLNVCRGALAISAMRVVVGWVGSCNDVALDRLDDIYLALETLVAGDTSQGGPLGLSVWVSDGIVHLTLEGLGDTYMRANLTTRGQSCPSIRWPLDIRLLLGTLMDDYSLVEGEGGSFGVSMNKSIR